MKIFKQSIFCLVILVLTVSLSTSYPKLERYSHAASISSNKIEKIPKIIKDNIKKILGNVTYLSVTTNKRQNLIITVEKDATKYKVVVDKNKKILKIQTITDNDTPEMGC